MTGFDSKRQMAQDKAMTRPIEADYTSQVAYTRALEAYCDTLAQPERGPVAWAIYDKRGGSKSLHWPEQHSPNGDANMFDAVPLYTTPPPCPTCEALARTVMMDQTSHDNFNPDWDAMAVMVEEQQRMAKRIEGLEAMLERQTAARGKT